MQHWSQQAHVDEVRRLVVGVGASAGGLEAFKAFLSSVPADGGMTWLLVQHLDPSHHSMLVELLRPCTAMTVTEARHGQALEPDTVYVIPPNTDMGIQQDRIVLSEPARHRGVKLPVDHLFRSLAEVYGPRAVAVVLSGAGSDGSAGIRAVKAAGGLTIAEKPSACRHESMPRSAIHTGAVDLVLELGQMFPAIERFSHLPPDATSGFLAPEVAPRGNGHALLQAPTPLEGPQPLSEAECEHLAAILDAHGDLDLRMYKSGTVGRRVVRRMTLAGYDATEPYFEHLRDSPEEQRALLRDLLISVTDFFRDPEAFAALRDEVVVPLITQAEPDSTVRCWVAGCATGEEAYSVAIELLDAIEAHGADKRLDLQVFATDVDRQALGVARAGIYPYSIAESVSAERLARYFSVYHDAGYETRPTLRDRVSFAVHDLTSDPPFSRMDLVTCRNVLIYLRPGAQARALNALHFSLATHGHLMLGTAESVGMRSDQFFTVSKRWRIYQKRGVSHLDLDLSRAGRTRSETLVRSLGARVDRSARRPHPVGPDDQARRTVLRTRVPPTVIVAQNDEILFMHGELRPFLRFPQGPGPRLNLRGLVQPEIATRTRAAIYTCRRDDESVTSVSSPADGEARVRIIATPAPEMGDGAVVVSFEQLADPPAPESRDAPDGAEQIGLIAQLEQELRATREDLRTTVEELETSNEELRSSNEESMTMNEELQSSNEELEATTEELRSLNEELNTVNAQLREKIELLERAHDDLANFFASTRIATLFLDPSLCLKRFTPSAGELLGLDHADLHRPLANIAGELLQRGLHAEAAQVLEQLNRTSQELQTRDGRWFSRRVLPYRTESRRIEGVVVNFVDITEIRLATQRLEARERQQAVIARLGLLALRAADLQTFMDQTVRQVQQVLGADYCKILELQPGGDSLLLRAGVGWQEDAVGQVAVSAGLDSQAGYTLESSAPVVVTDLTQEHRFTGPQLLLDHGVVSGFSCPIRGDEGNYGVLGVHTIEAREFTPEDTYFLQAVAAVIGSAVARTQARLRLSIERGVARCLADARNRKAALDRVLQCLLQEADAAVCELWWPNEEETVLTCRGLVVTQGEREDEVREQFCSRQFAVGDGLVGRVYQEERASWITDFRDPLEFVRVEEARDLGLVSGLALPIAIRGRTLGVITIFVRYRLVADTVFLRSMEVVGRSIGDHLTRLDVEAEARRLAAVVESSHDAIVAWDFEGLITGWFGGATALYGFEADEVVGTPVTRLIPDDQLSAHFDLVSGVQAEGHVNEAVETSRRCRDGTRVDVSVRVSPVRDPEGRVVGLASTERDIRRQKDTQRRLVEADRQKDQFLAMLGHELRNPLAAIKSAASLLRSTPDDAAAVTRMQAVIERQSEHMARLLDGLLDVSRIVRGKISLSRQVVELSELVQGVVNDAARRDAAKRITLETALEPGPLWVEVDTTRMVQVVDNLLSNALKYTASGGRVAVRTYRDDHHAVVEVVDDGVGIDAELLPHVFEVFRQASQDVDRAEGGLGLGLALVKSLVELHGGTVEADSEGRGHGARFAVRLPLTLKAPQVEQVITDAARAWRILIIDDNVDLCDTLRMLLEMEGHTVVVAKDGAEGLELAHSTDLDAVVCDLGLPDGMSGYDVARALRSDPDTRGLPLVAFTGHGRTEDVSRSRDAGFDAHLTKPIEVEDIERTLAKLLR